MFLFRGERLDFNIIDDEDFMEHLVRYAFARERSVGTVLDIACGVGYGSYFLAQQDAVRSVTGADISSEAVAYAQNTFRHPGLSYTVASALDTGCASQSFDTIVSLETFEHLQELDAYMNEMKRLLKPDGRYILSVPNRKFFSGAGIRNEFHYNEMEYTQLTGFLTGRFAEVALFYQSYPLDRYQHLLSATPCPPAPGGNLRWMPGALLNALRAVKSRWYYRTLARRSVRARYGLDFMKFLTQNQSLAQRYDILPIADAEPDRTPGNFLAVCARALADE